MPDRFFFTSFRKDQALVLTICTSWIALDVEVPSHEGSKLSFVELGTLICETWPTRGRLSTQERAGEGKWWWTTCTLMLLFLAAVRAAGKEGGGSGVCLVLSILMSDANISALPFAALLSHMLFLKEDTIKNLEILCCIYVKGERKMTHTKKKLYQKKGIWYLQLLATIELLQPCEHIFYYSKHSQEQKNVRYLLVKLKEEISVDMTIETVAKKN